MRLNNYKRNPSKTKKKGTQKLFHQYYREVYWQHCLKIFFTNGLNKPDEYCF